MPGRGAKEDENGDIDIEEDDEMKTKEAVQNEAKKVTQDELEAFDEISRAMHRNLTEVANNVDDHERWKWEDDTPRIKKQ